MNNPEDRINRNLDELPTVIQGIYHDSIEMLYGDSKARKEYIETDEISIEDKLEDLDGLIDYAEKHEMYEHCKMLLDIKHEVLPSKI